MLAENWKTLMVYEWEAWEGTIHLMPLLYQGKAEFLAHSAGAIHLASVVL